ncbi:rhamnan synthesis F family protein [Propionispira raffinosivorans]|uniref:rhamnan synthesis F family protein n=1 Tax=Propionispira raffinosivorans TaxID=86959 RepID=UPI00035E5DF3|nr:rhamnan synthesis F family protein [Propionispira raffinosivorans]
MNRLCIFQMYDKDGIVDRYVLYLLAELRSVSNRLVVVYNGMIKAEYESMLKKYADNVYIRADLGGDAGAYKEALNKFIGWENVYKYDELILSNDTYYGPFVHWSNIFSAMEKKSELDYWGLTKMSETDDTNRSEMVHGWFSYIPRHIQAYFVVVRKNLLCSNIFRDFWNKNNLGIAGSYKTAVADFEFAFTSDFEKAGYKWGTYVGDTKYDSSCKNNNFPQCTLHAGELIYRYQCPVLKKKAFMQIDDIFLHSGHEDLRRGMEYIVKETDYDVNMIWENLLRVYNVVDLRESLHLNYILPIDKSSTDMKSDDKVIIFNMPYQEQIEKNFTDYVAILSNDTPIIIVVRDGAEAALLKEKCLATGKKQYNIVVYNGNCFFEWISGQEKILNQYKYICVVNDYRVEKRESILIEETFKCNTWNNLIQNDDYIENVIELFNGNSKMGLLAPSEAYHARFFAELGDTWSGCFGETKVLSKKLGLKCNLSIVKSTFGYAGSFWCRTEILTALFKKNFNIEQWVTTEFEEARRKALYRILIYMAQSAGFYSATLETAEYASVANVDLQYLLQKLVNRAQVEFGSREFVSFINAWRDKQMIEFARKHKKIYIYGAGDYGTGICEILQKAGVYVNGFLISNGQKKLSIKWPISIEYISDMNFIDNIGIIIAVKQSSQAFLLQEAQKHGCKHIFCI